MAEVKGLTYVPEIYEEILKNVTLNDESQVLEVGIGFGQATAPILATDANVTALEPDENVAKVCAETFADNENLSVITAKLEDYEAADETFDLVYSASAFHEVKQDIGYTKAYAMLKKGGIFARFSNHAMRSIERPNLSAAIQKLYTIYLPKTGTPRPYKEVQAQKRAEIALKYGFEEISYKRYYRTRVYTTDELIAYLATDEDHLAISKTKREAFFNELRKLMERYGGKITYYDTIDLQIAKKI
ncbi:MAG: class I SAM-dependent methyltransferase [Clostridia bacterium]|nr:class I SAM-dependent methyltransferase [Clostridia bacterium]